MRKLLLCFIGVLAFAVSGMAAPLVLPSGTPVFFQYNNLEQVSALNNLVVPAGYAPASGTQGNWGVLNVSSIQLGGISLNHTDISGGPTFFSDDGPGGTQGMITGIFYGLQITGPTTATGGFMDLFWHDAGADFTLGATQAAEVACLQGGCAPNSATVTAFTTGTLLVRIQFASGIINGNAVVTLSSDIDPTTISGTGHADGFGNVVLAAGGPWATALNSDWFFVDPNGNGTPGEPGETRDIRFSTLFNGLPSWNGTANSNPGAVGLRSNDPARTVTTPEANPLLLLGLGLVGIGFVAQRKVRVRETHR
jgi:hypothetical protein